eukprot:CAMPEP_0181177372 /NCGR_PEP_ID=MMETSP1096-20121128/5125_1 /TAXON_ID=156174 ORGANISM="Chrysochromulina ericina, Strain CCMP281" /NCGR_SAMPLE_ID=MMETSP1096 /ASSEMBLY_ACC=CAM_ASM_000453 /LENGTH=62 /DNA_ID=CAMNT_0023265517 /DNA_START=363 /DNA_END=548 /DNA_ORIENTATION=+
MPNPTTKVASVSITFAAATTCPGVTSAVRRSGPLTLALLALLLALLFVLAVLLVLLAVVLLA